MPRPAVLSHRPGRLRPAVAAAVGRTAAGAEGRMPARAHRPAGARRRTDRRGLAAGAAGRDVFHSPSDPQRSLQRSPVSRCSQTLSRRRRPAPGGARRARRPRPRPAGGDQRYPCAQPGAPAAAGRAHLHPRALHHSRGGLPPLRQRRAPPEVARGDGAAVRPLAGRDRPHAGNRRALPLLARRTALRVPGRSDPGRPHAAAGAGPPRLGGSRRALSGRASRAKCGRRSSTSSS